METMAGFINRRNIDRYRQLLDVATDEAQRKMLADLLAEEEAKQAVTAAKKEQRG